MPGKLPKPMWLQRQILHPDHVQDLETRAAVHEFGSGIPREQAEQKAHEDYVREHRIQAAAHHLQGIRAATAAGDRDSAREHALQYQAHVGALGHEAVGPIPDEVVARMNHPDHKGPYKFKGHAADTWSGDELGKSESEGRTCQWRLGERRCKLPGSRKVGDRHYCHHHENHWANRIMDKSEIEAELEQVQALLKAVADGTRTLNLKVPARTAPAKPALDLGDVDTDSMFDNIQDAAAPAPTQSGPALHNDLGGFARAWTGTKDKTAKLNMLTQHMQHPAFLQAMQQHPQGQKLMAAGNRLLNSKTNAGVKGNIVATAKTEVELALEGLYKAFPDLVKGDVVPFPGAKAAPAAAAPGKKAKAIPISRGSKIKQIREQAKKAQDLDRFTQAFDSMMQELASDPGMQAQARKRQVAEKEQVLKRGPQLFQPGHKVVTARTDGGIPSDWVGTVVRHHDQYGDEWGDGPGPHHAYEVKWHNPKLNQVHEDFVTQADLKPHPG